MPLALIGSLKGIEYLVLGWILGVVSRREWNLGVFRATGAGIGLALGTLIVVVLTNLAVVPASLVTVLPRAINEVIFPIGCALVLWSSDVAAQSRAVAQAAPRPR